MKSKTTSEGVTIGFEGVNSPEDGEQIISGPDPTTYWQEICTVPIGP